MKWKERFGYMLKSWIIMTMIWISNSASHTESIEIAKTSSLRAYMHNFTLNWNLRFVLLVFYIRTQFRSGVRSVRMAPCSASHCVESECSSQARQLRRLPALHTFSTVHLKSGDWKRPRWAVWWITCLIPAVKSRTMGGYFFLHTVPSSAPTNSSSCFYRGVCECLHAECRNSFTMCVCV